MKKMRLLIDVNDSFEKGMCYDCPLSDGDGNCILLCKYDECPLQSDNTIRFVPCRCGANNRDTWHIYGGGVRITCRKCGYMASGKNYTEAKKKWVEGALKK